MVKRILLVKTLRDLARHKLALTALIAIIAVGVSVFVSMLGAYFDMAGAQTRYYDAHRLADFTVSLKRAPAWTLQLIREIPNVKAVWGRVHLSARIDLEDTEEPISGFAISMPATRRPVINDLYLRTGTWFSGDRAKEVILNAAFAEEHDLKPGDRIKVLLLDKEHDLLVVGTAMSPEFVYVIPPGGGIAPDPARFAVLYLPEGFAQASCDLDGAFNQVVGQVFDGSPGVLDETLDRIERRLDPYGVTFVTPASEQPSVRFVADELTSLKITATILPALFLGVAALVLNVLMRRMVQQQRSIIGTLRAVGYTRSAIVRHYLSFGAFVGIIGALFGLALGYGLQELMLWNYRKFFRIPHIVGHLHPSTIMVGLLISVVFAILGTLKGVQRAASLEPAEAMRPPPPEKGARVLPERFPAFWEPLTFRMKMILRAIFRNPFRSTVGIVATLVSTSLVCATLGIYDSFRYMMGYQFNRVMHQDYTVSLRDPEGRRSVSELQALSHVTTIEPQLVVTCDFTNGPYKKRTGLTGLPREGRLFTPLDAAGRPIRPPRDGLVVDTKLADILHVKPGDAVRLRPLIGRRRQVRAVVVGTADSFLGITAYADIDYLSRLLGEDSSANVLLADSTTGKPGTQAIEQLRRRPEVIGLGERRRSLEQLDETFGSMMAFSLGITILFSGLIAFGSVLNAAMVSLSERRREVGTLRVLGYTNGQIARLFSGESLLVNGLGVLLGLVAGIGLTALMSKAYNTEMYRFPVVITPSQLIISAVAMAAFVALAQLIVYRMIRKLPWLEVLNVKE